MRQLTPCCIAAGVTPIENIEYDIFASLPRRSRSPQAELCTECRETCPLAEELCWLDTGSLM